MEKLLLEVRDAFVGYGGADVVRGVSFTVSAGERVCLIGANGCGKTTLMRAIAGRLRYRGSILICGNETRLLSSRERALRLGVVTQGGDGGGFPYTVRELVSFGRYAQRRSLFYSAEDRLAVDAALSELELEPIAEARADELSGGQRQRAALARTFAGGAPLILLDEPTTHLDLKYQLELLSLLRRRTEDAGAGVLAVLHDLALARIFADKLIMLRDGAVFAAGTAERVLTRENIAACFGETVAEFLAKGERGK